MAETLWTLKPQRTDGGHRSFNDADIDRIREIKRWIDNGVRVSKVKVLLSSDSSEQPNGAGARTTAGDPAALSAKQ